MSEECLSATPPLVSAFGIVTSGVKIVPILVSRHSRLSRFDAVDKSQGWLCNGKSEWQTNNSADEIVRTVGLT